MNLINKSNGQTVVITKIHPQLNFVTYKHYSYGGSAEFTKAKHIFQYYNIESDYSNEVSIKRRCYEALIAEVYSGFEISNDSRNWLFELRPIRVYIPDVITAKAINNNDALGELLEGIRLTIPIEFRIATQGGVVTYLEELYPEHRALLESYPDIRIEPKEILSI